MGAENVGLNRVSLSKSALLLSPCIAWAGLGVPWYDETKVDEEDMSKRDKGTLFHKLIAAGASENELAWGAPEDVVKWYDHAKLYVEQVLLPRCDSYQTEVCVGINWSTGQSEVFPFITDRNYPVREGWQFGTADVVCVLKDGSLLIADWKTGGSGGATEQLLSLAAGFQKCMPGKPPEDWGQRPVIISCLQVNDDGVWPHERDVPQSELDSHWDSMRFQWEDVVANKRMVPQPGVHCTALYCPHLGHCEAIGSAVAEMADQAETSPAAPLVPARALMRKVTEKPLTNTDAGDKMALISAANRQIKYATEQMKAYTQDGGKVICGQYEWAKGNDGYRWRKSK